MKKIIAGMALVAVFASVQVWAQIQSTVTSGGDMDCCHMQSEGMKNFSKDTPCYLNDGSRDHSTPFEKRVLQLFKEEGFNITDDKNAECTINLDGWINADSGEKSLYSDKPDEWTGKEVEPNPKVAAAINDARAKAAAAKAGEPIGGNGINLLTQAGGLLGNNGAALGSAGVVVNLLSMFSGGEKSPVGVADIEGSIRFGGVFFHKIPVALSVYTASNVPEKPEDLFFAGFKAAIEDMKLSIYKYHLIINQPFDMPVSAEMATNAQEWAKAQAAGK